MKELEKGTPIAGIRTSPQSFHPVLDLQHWRTLLPQEVVPVCGTSDVSVPDEFLENEALREKVRAAGVDLGDPKPVDLFFWSSEPVSSPWLTKYGGLPFRSKNKPWPMKNGTLATFVAQICFRDSLDLFDFELPGDLLTIFSIRKDVWGHDESDPDYPIIVEWEKINEVDSPLTTKDEIHCNFQVPELAGIRLRTYDYDFESTSEDDLREKLIPLASYSWVSVVSLPGTKIGRTYYPVQPGWDPRDWIKEEAKGNWKFVATLYSVSMYLTLQRAALNKGWSNDYIHWPKFEMGDPGHLVLFTSPSPKACSYFIFG